jgi:hypothetical protein
MKNAAGQKGVVTKVPQDAVEVYLGMELTVTGEVADMWVVERYDGSQTYIPKDCFTVGKDASISDHLNDLMVKVEEVIDVADHQKLIELANHLEVIKNQINDLTMDVDAGE